MTYRFKQLSADDVPLLKELLAVFRAAFEDSAYDAAPGDDYLRSLLAKGHFMALVAIAGDKVVGGLAAYELEKFEQDRREIYIYDLAVAALHRRQGIARQLILELKRCAKRRKAYVIFVQADEEDRAAIRLYESLGAKERAYQFDIPVDS